jgi:hypothetical protein
MPGRQKIKDYLKKATECQVEPVETALPATIE